MAKDAFLFLPAKILEGLLLMFVTALYSAVFSAEAVTDFRYVNTTVLFSYLVGCSFLANAITRYVGEENIKDKAKKLYSTVLSVYMIFCIAAFLICGILYFITGEMLFVLGAVMFCSYALFQMLNGALIQLSKIRASIFLSLLSAVLKLAVAYILVFGQTDGFPSAYPAVIANIVADLSAGLIAVFVLKIPRVFSLFSFSKDMFKTVLTFGVPLMGLSVNVGILNLVDTYLVGFFHGDIAVAVYAQNYTIASSVFTMINVAVMRAVYPNLLRRFREEGEAQTLPHLNSGVRLYMLIAFPAAAGLFGVSYILSKFMFVKELYHYGAPVIGLTAVAMVFMGLTEYANKAYELRANTRPIFQNSLIAAICKITFSAFLLYFFSYIFSAIGTLLAFAVYFFVTAIRVRKLFLFQVKAVTIIKIAVCAILCGITAYFTALLPISPIFALILSVISGAIIYVITLALSGEIKDEINYFRKLRKTGGLK